MKKTIANTSTIIFFVPKKLKEDFRSKVYRNGEDMSTVLRKMIEYYVKGAK